MSKTGINWQSDETAKRLARRYAAERRFKALGLAAILVSLAFLAFLLVAMLAKGVGGIDLQFLTASEDRKSVV